MVHSKATREAFGREMAPPQTLLKIYSRNVVYLMCQALHALSIDTKNILLSALMHV